MYEIYVSSHPFVLVSSQSHKPSNDGCDSHKCHSVMMAKNTSYTRTVLMPRKAD
jgi:hypothetical protein